MTFYLLLLNLDKTEVIVVGPEPLRETLSDQINTLDGINLPPSSNVIFLGQDIKPHIAPGCAVIVAATSRTALFSLCFTSS